MRIATWNVNSIRARVERVLSYLQTRQIDILALQETKAHDDAFPTSQFAAAGYEVASWGLDQWNGVAIISRVGVEDVERSFAGQPTFGDGAVLEARAIGASCAGVRVWSVYVPHGRGPDDPHMAYKLGFLHALAEAARGWIGPDMRKPEPSPAEPTRGQASRGTHDPRPLIAICGDFNVAPRDGDVWDASLFREETHVSPAARDALSGLERAGYTEATRLFLPGDGLYTQWDYRALRFPKNEGMRIDFAFCSPALVARASRAAIVRDERKGHGASDHVPVEVDFDG